MGNQPKKVGNCCAGHRGWRNAGYLSLHTVRQSPMLPVQGMPDAEFHNVSGFISSVSCGGRGMDQIRGHCKLPLPSPQSSTGRPFAQQSKRGTGVLFHSMKSASRCCYTTTYIRRDPSAVWRIWRERISRFGQRMPRGKKKTPPKTKAPTSMSLK